MTIEVLEETSYSRVHFEERTKQMALVSNVLANCFFSYGNFLVVLNSRNYYYVTCCLVPDYFSNRQDFAVIENRKGGYERRRAVSKLWNPGSIGFFLIT